MIKGEYCEIGIRNWFYWRSKGKFEFGTWTCMYLRMQLENLKLLFQLRLRFPMQIYEFGAS